ncbi:hypothetical protein [Evansella vedderi]|uniref:hypothetical protein n=1 Tax=Evansella vedderi TaxID=38282 RepID=UPI0027D8869C|nr:hypothetical protein [Evansella vedderi]
MFNYEELKLYQVHVENKATGFMTVHDIIHGKFKQLITYVKQSFDTPNDSVATSIFMRRYGFFIAAQLFLKAHHKIWDGPLENIYLVENEGGITFNLDGKYVRAAQENDLEMIVEKYGHNVVQRMSMLGHLSKITLWENIWGYVQWMYSQLELEQGKKDLKTLLDDAVWHPHTRTSMFRKFLAGQKFEEAAKNYKRITCCLLKELPATTKCPYCPHLKK